MNEITKRKNLTPPAWGLVADHDTLSNWLAAYFELEVTTAATASSPVPATTTGGFGWYVHPPLKYWITEH